LSENDEYEIGYRKPPKASRWRKGQSGNRRGRQKGVRNLRTELIEELGEIISVKEQGIPRRITKQRALIKAMTAQAVQGDTRAGSILINLMFRLLHPELIEGASTTELAKEDQAILDNYVVRRRTPVNQSAPDEEASST
jgi:hypothetical protein